MKPSVSNVYQNFIWQGEPKILAEQLYNNPVSTLGGIKRRAVSLIENYGKTGWHIQERTDALCESLVKANRKLGCLTPKVKENIKQLAKGAVEASHQSIVMAGPCYILNKAATAELVASLNMDEKSQLTPFFFIADYDIVQPELTNIRTPLMGSDGNLISLPVPKGYENSPVSIIPLPNIDWYENAEENIRSGYHPMLKELPGQARILFEERLEQALALIRWGFMTSKTLGEWAAKILARLFNIEGNLGLPILPASDPAIRQLMIEGMEFLLMRKNREIFLKAHKTATELIIDAGLKPGIGSRDSGYVPFFYECQEGNCNKSRIELNYEDRGSVASLTGKCPACSEKVEIEAVADDPYLGEVAKFLSPRVDTRQLIIDTLVPVIAHIGGVGEAAYYAQVIPVARALSAPFPLFIKYPRVYFNTPWNEQLAASLKESEETVLHNPGLFKLIGQISRDRRKESYDEMNTKINELGKLISDIHNELNERIEVVDEKRRDFGEDKIQSLKLELERYLSWTFGQYAKEKLGQESSWSWIEWSLNSGFPDIFGPYQRAYVSEMKNGATIFVNFII